MHPHYTAETYRVRACVCVCVCIVRKCLVHTRVVVDARLPGDIKCGMQL